MNKSSKNIFVGFRIKSWSVNPFYIQVALHALVVIMNYLIQSLNALSVGPDSISIVPEVMLMENAINALIESCHLVWKIQSASVLFVWTNPIHLW